MQPPALLAVPNPDALAIRLLVFDFDGVFTDNAVYVDQDGRESVRCWRSDGLGLQKLKALGLPCWVLSTEVVPIVARRCEKLGLPVRHGLSDKRRALHELAEELQIPLEAVAYVGNDINDLGCLELAGIPMAVQDAYPDAKALARYQTTRPGGYGAVREICDWIAACHRQKEA